MMELFIPTRIQKENIFGKGFGKREMRRTVIGGIIGLGIGLFIGLFFFNETFQNILISTIGIGAGFAVISYFLCVKNSINLSVIDFFALMLCFFSHQRRYLYSKMKEWC